MYLPELSRARVVAREKRFRLLVEIDSRTEVAYLPNPGRLQEIIFNGAQVYVARREAPTRKTRYEAVLGLTNYTFVALNASKANEIFLENIDKMPFNVKSVRREFTYRGSRFDFLINDEIIIEVKSCTLVEHCIGLFPDAPTKRGVKHLRTLLEWQGKKGLIFVVQRNDAKAVSANYVMDPEFGNAFRDIFGHVDYLLAFTCNVDTNKIIFKEFVPVLKEPLLQDENCDF
ncbi:MAG TPA: DNA/RNA nuclease SfsA [Candidatus Hydrothermia bacterium]|nr:DNA/RNA nuclease SfsA [Candidatus Hydrothermia bacterium]HOL23585.1 DNA/RNA nuclease SfsA [Candidatus Hydrothermia bacterium]HOP32317.1 DNA/RNA nuclease SfsA [Candidatus Hydrothermia bacterium]HPO78591.1 DNA/RNA nuclease SfsA [Candidatus Hydrothermia bacterium]